MHRREFLRRTLAAGAWTGVAEVGLPPVASAEGAREFTLVARPADVPVEPGRVWRTWTYNGVVPGPEIRVREGDLLRVTLRNELPQATSIHWHGLPVPNAMDGVAGLTQPPVAPGESFTYEFRTTPAGTYFYHSHAGLQLDRGLYGPLVIEPTEVLPPTQVDREYVLLLDDWLTITPEEAWAQLQRGGGMMGGMMGGGDPLYQGYLLNGATSAATVPLRAARGERVRLRVVNAASATTFRVGLAGHTMIVTHSDGQAVQSVSVDSFVIGMGERYDVLVNANNPGVWPLLAGPVDDVVPGIVAPFAYEGSVDRLAPVAVWPAALVRGRTLRYADLVATAAGPPAMTGSTTTIPLSLGMARGGVAWTINGQAYPNATPIGIRAGETVRLSIVNATMTRHPIHLHGHFFRLLQAANGSPGPVKDTILIPAMMGRADIEFVADNPGRWLFHCHHLYHMEGGMARVLDYL